MSLPGLPSVGTVIGHDALRQQLAGALETSAVLWLWGRPGIGKTTLAVDAVKQRARAGYLLAPPGATLTWLVLSLLEGQRRRSVETTAERVLELVGEGCLVIDDAHQLADAELEQLTRLFVKHDRGRLVVVSRRAPPHQLPGMHATHLPPLDPASARSVLAQVSPGLDDVEVRHALTVCAGSPWHLKTWPTHRGRGLLAAELPAQLRPVLSVLRCVEGPLGEGALPAVELRELDLLGWLERRRDGVSLHPLLLKLLDAEFGEITDGERMKALELLRRRVSTRTDVERVVLLAQALGREDEVEALLATHFERLLEVPSASLFEALRRSRRQLVVLWCARAALALQGRQHLDWLVRQSTDDAAVAALVAEALIELGRSIEAIAILSQHPPTGAILRQLAVARAMNFEIAEALELLSKLDLSTNTEQVLASLVRAVVMSLAGEPSAALAAAHEAIAAPAVEAWAQRERNGLLLAVCATAAEPELAEKPDAGSASARRLNNFALCAVLRGELEAAREAIEGAERRALGPDIEQARGLFARARLEFVKGDFVAARAVAAGFARLLEDPDEGRSMMRWGAAIYGWINLALVEHAWTGEHRLTPPVQVEGIAGVFHHALSLRVGAASSAGAPLLFNRDVELYDRLASALGAALRGESDTAVSVLRFAAAAEHRLRRAAGVAEVASWAKDLAGLLHEETARSVLEWAAGLLQTQGEAMSSPRFLVEARLCRALLRGERGELEWVRTQDAVSPIAARQAALALGTSSAPGDRCDRAFAALWARWSSRPWVVDLKRGTVRRDGVVVSLGRRRVLYALLAALRAEVDREALAREVWGVRSYHPARDDKRIDVAIGRLRALLDDDRQAPRYVLTRPGGYVLSPEVQFVG